MKTELFHSTEQIEITGLDDGSCRVRTPGSDLVLTYDAVYDLALRLASYIQHVDESDEREAKSLH